MRVCFFGLAIALTSSFNLYAADKAKIDGAIQKAVDRLLADQDSSSGAWRWDEKHDDIKKDTRAVGMTALAVLALYENGIQPTEPQIRKALKFLRDRTPQIEDTYSVALTTIVLSRIGKRQDHDLIRECAQRLVHSQLETGAWHYTTRRASRDRALKPSEEKKLGDLSVTQFAVIALWQAQRAIPFNAEPALRITRKRLAWAQTADGGWNYPGVGDLGGGSHTMTTAAAYLWLVSSAAEIKQGKFKGMEKLTPATGGTFYSTLQESAQDHKRDQAKKNSDKGPKEGEERGQIDYVYPVTSPPELDLKTPSPLVKDPVIEKAMKRVNQLAESGVGNRGMGGNWYYYLWSVQRLGVLLGAEKFGKTDWYDVGSSAIVAAQNEDGAFGPTKENADKHLMKYGPDTAFALLFLRKANLGSDVAKLINPDPDSPFRIAERDRKYKTLADALKEANAGEKIIVNGDGPFELAGLVIDKPVSIVASAGYEPVFLYKRPIVNGFEANYSTNPEYRTMINIKLATPAGKNDQVSFEGIRFQMDPPAGTIGPFLVLRCEGIQAAFCNCSFTTAERKHGGLFEVVDSPRFMVRNSFIVGFTPTVSVVSNKGKTERGTRLGFQDCIAFTPKFLEAKGDGSVDLFLMLNSLHTDSIFNVGELSGPMKLFVENNVFRGRELFEDLGTSERAWSGQKNLYDVDRWISKGGKASAAQIRTVDNWMAHWSGQEVGSGAAAKLFVVSRQQVGSFRHNLNPRDWTVKPDLIRRTMQIDENEQIGANEAYVGPGDSFLRFRELGSFVEWTKLSRPSRGE